VENKLTFIFLALVEMPTIYPSIQAYVPVVQMGSILGANSTTPEQDGSRCIDQQRGRWLVIEYLAGILASIDPAEMPSSVKTVDW